MAARVPAASARQPACRFERMAIMLRGVPPGAGNPAALPSPCAVHRPVAARISHGRGVRRMQARTRRFRCSACVAASRRRRALHHMPA